MPLIMFTSPLNTSILIQTDRIVSVASIPLDDGTEHSLITMTHGDPITVTEDPGEIDEAIRAFIGS